jgi:hypothetical protein
VSSIEALSPVFGDPQGHRFCVTLQGKHKLEQLGARSEKPLTEEEWIEQHAKDVTPSSPALPETDGDRKDR